eukprot:TRINITY_DN81811_c0_g1_i1.p1 TRINITY_DN81811_c0_g1~~TRINITY_DN81811_c0_g1_i1.p1  ORF type:complete len:232 (-),score=22.58 TRINITY_DN81811_c0_g1_i1:67-762(-)
MLGCACGLPFSWLHAGADGVARYYLPKEVDGQSVLKDVGDGKFRVLPQKGLAYRLSQSLEHKHTSEGVDCNQIVHGVVDGEWVMVELAYIPKTLDGVQVLKDLGNDKFRVLPKQGVAYRLSTNLTDRCSDVGLDHNYVFHGVDIGDWVRTQRVEKAVDGLYLPRTVNGVETLEHQGQDRYKVLPEQGMAFRSSKNLGDRYNGGNGVETKTLISGTVEGDWLRVHRVGGRSS